MKRIAWVLLLFLLGMTYFLSSIPGLKVLPVFRQADSALHALGFGLTRLAGFLAARLPEQIGPAKAVAAQLYQFAQANPETMEFLVRKSAHVTLFCLITIAFFFLLRQYLENPWGALCGAAVLGSGIAVLDEIYQTTVSGRSGTVVDIMIDFIGVALAFFFIIFALFITGRHRAQQP